MTKTVIAFDLYGTLLSTESIAQKLAELYGDEKAKVIATQARRYQLEYSWRINSMGGSEDMPHDEALTLTAKCLGMYSSFDKLTRSSFRHATTEASVNFTKDQEDRIMHAYNGLDAFSEVDRALKILEDTPSLDPCIFSNGTFDMITSSLKTSPDLSAAAHLLPAAKVISVDSLHLYKPDRRTYEHLTKTVGLENDPDKVWLVSSNPFDVAGAVGAGLRAAWVDRAGSGWIDGLAEALAIEPTIIVGGVDEAVDEIKRLGGN